MYRAQTRNFEMQNMSPLFRKKFRQQNWILNYNVTENNDVSLAKFKVVFEMFWYRTDLRNENNNF